MCTSPVPNLNAVFKADPTGVVTRIAGTGVVGYSGDSGPALSAQLNYPNGVAMDASGNVYIADTNNARIRKVDTSRRHHHRGRQRAAAATRATAARPPARS